MARVVCVHPDGSERVIESGLSIEHAQGMAEHLIALGEVPGATYYVEPETVGRPGPVAVPADVFEGLQRVRQSGVTNMLDQSAVQYWAHQFGYYSAVIWIGDNPDEYVRGVFGGFEPVEGEHA